MQTVIKQITDNLQTIAENTVKVYNAGLEEGKKLGGDYQTAYQQGYDDGVLAGYDNGREEGKVEGSAQYKELISQEFVKAITNDGTRATYSNGTFRYWNMSLFKHLNITFKPKGSCNYTFGNTTFDDDTPFPYDNIKLDFSSTTSANYLFANSDIQHISTLDISNATSASYIFQNCANLVIIDKLIISENGGLSFGTTAASSPFKGCINLESLTIEGCIGKYFNIAEATKLNGASILSILKALKKENTAVNIILPINTQKYITPDNTAFSQEIYDEYTRAINYYGDNNYKYTISFE